MTELLYHVNEQDDVIGPVERSEAHKNNILHRSGMAFILNTKGEVFVQHRANKETFPNCFDSSSAFHVTFGESYDVAVRREVFEELGLKVDLKFIGKFTHHDDPEHEVMATYIGHAEEIPKLDLTEAYSGEWCDMERLRKIIESGDVTPWLRDGFKLLVHHLSLKK